MTKVAEGREQKAVGAMFDGISRRYDLANRILSLGIDQTWRNRAIASLGSLGGKTHLDVAAGTGDLLWLTGKLTSPPLHRIALDYSLNMMRFGRSNRPTETVDWLQGSADRIPLQNASVDAITISFGIRNVAEYPTAICEFYRVLAPNGKVAVLEFSMPANRIWNTIYGFYFKNVLPLIGGALSGNYDAYRYLPASVAKFPYGEAFAVYLRSAGFSDVKFVPLTGGIATLYTATKK